MATALITTYRSIVPLWIQARDENASDTQAIPQVVHAFLQQMRQAKEVLF